MIVAKINTPFRKFLEGLKIPSVPLMKGGVIFAGQAGRSGLFSFHQKGG